MQGLIVMLVATTIPFALLLFTGEERRDGGVLALVYVSAIGLILTASAIRAGGDGIARWLDFATAGFGSV